MNSKREFNSESQLKAEFKRCAKIVFPPAKFPRGVGAEQHRDMVRMFAMGWTQALVRLIPFSEEARTLAAEYTHTVGQVISNADWFPDSTWNWW